MSASRGLKLLLWKNYLLQIRHPIITAIELMIPVMFMATLSVIRLNVDYDKTVEPTIYKTFDIKHIPDDYFGETIKIPKWIVLYAPNTTKMNIFMGHLVKTLDAITNATFDRNTTEEGSIDYYQTQQYHLQSVIFCLIVFDNSVPLGKGLKYKLRFPFSPRFGKIDDFQPYKTWYPSFTFPLFQRPGPRMAEFNEGGSPGYAEEGFLAMQHAIAVTITKELVKKLPIDERPQKVLRQLNKFEKNIQMCRFPYPPYIDDVMIFALNFFLPIILLLCFIYPVVNLTKNLVVEKEKRLKESMKMMGLKSWLHWTAWFIKSFFWLTFSAALISILLTIDYTSDGVGIFNHSNLFLIFLFFTLYNISCITLAFLMSTFFSRSNVASVGSGVIFFVTFMPYFFLFPRYRDLSWTVKIFACFSCNTALTFGSMMIIMWEGAETGVHWWNLTIPASPDDSLTLFITMTMFLIDSVIYMLLTIYIENVFPGEYGIPQKWYFPFTKRYWAGEQVDRHPKELENKQANVTNDEHFENDNCTSQVGIRIVNLAKSFDGHNFVVKGVNLNAYSGQITALLGHNGAGKTTTISMLTGLYPPSGGTAYLNGFDIVEDMDKVRASLGICPQFDVLFDELTVAEHLRFFCYLKNADKEKHKKEITQMIKMLGLEDKTHNQSQTLSGGQKRKLSVGIALIGNSKIVILDEPTSGMDVFARRFIWDLLLKERKSRTILLSTHFMEEADILSEKIAIMSGGQVMCCGSPAFLKNKYGTGYKLIIVKANDSIDVTPITQLIKKHIVSAQLKSSSHTELSYSLPINQRQTFPELFNEMETNKQQLGIDSYGLSFTTMDEVFLKVGKYATELTERMEMEHKSDENLESKESEPEVRQRSEDRNKGLVFLGQQFRGLLQKKVLFSLRNPFLTATQLLLPMFFTMLILTIVRLWPKARRTTQRNISLDNYIGTRTPLFVRNNDSQQIDDIVDSYRSLFDIEQPGDDKYIVNKHVIYEPMINSSTLIEFKKNVAEFLLNETSKNIAKFNMFVPIGAIFHTYEYNISGNDEFSHGQIMTTALFNNQPYHAISLSLNMIDNAMARHFSKRPNYTISLMNEPLPASVSDVLQFAKKGQIAFHLGWVLMFGMAFLSASFAIFIVKEKSVKMKHLQQVCGLELYLYYLTSFIWDYLIYIIASVLTIFMYYLYGITELETYDQQFRLFLVFAAHGLAQLPFIYLLSFGFEMPSSAYVFICLFNLMAGISTFIVVMILEVPELKLINLGHSIDWNSSIFVTIYNLGRSVYNLYHNFLGIKYCNDERIKEICGLDVIPVKELVEKIENRFPDLAEKFREFLEPGKTMNTTMKVPIPKAIKMCCRTKCGDNCFHWSENYFDIESPGVGRLVILTLCQAIVFWILVILIEMNAIKVLKDVWIQFKFLVLRAFRRNPRNEKQHELKDPDVITEMNRIKTTELKQLIKTDTLIVKDLTKYFGDFLAVDHIFYGVKRGECFGMLGVNGAGKTTTFKMITGDESISSGDVYVNGYNVKKNLRQVQNKLGYCPQFEGLLDDLTGRETLVLFCRLRGIKEPDINRHVLDLSKLLYFDIHIDKLVKTYSGGTKRKLSTALAVIGDPSVSFLDEPTTGVDPVARRCLWDALHKKLKEGLSIVLTSHSMEECESLCNRLIIMVNGRICCIGSAQHLKNRFGKGFIVHIKVKISETVEQNIKELEEFMNNSFEGTEVKELYFNSIKFVINNLSISWAKIFDTIERSKDRLNIEDYSVGQTTLEEIFLSFASKQKTD